MPRTRESFVPTRFCEGERIPPHDGSALEPTCRLFMAHCAIEAVRHAIMGEVERARMDLREMSLLIDIFYDSHIPTIFEDNFEDFYCAVVTLAKTRLYEKIDKEYK